MPGPRLDFWKLREIRFEEPDLTNFPGLALAYEAGPYGITVNAILPGWVRTPKVEQVAADSRPEDPEGAMRDMAGFIPLGRLCRVEEIGDLVAFLASDDAKYITGTEMVIDGGSTLPETFNILHA